MRALKAVWCLLALAATPAQANTTIDHYPLTTSGAVDWCVVSGSTVVCPAFMWTLSQAVAATVTPEVGGFAMTASGTPVRVLDGTFPNGLSATNGYGHKLSTGNNWYATDADSGAVMDPLGDFSVCAVVTPRTWATVGFIAGKWNATGDQRGWALYLNSVDGAAYFGVSNTGAVGGVVNTIKAGTPCALGRTCFICATYDFKTSGTSVGSVYVDGLSVATVSTVTGPPLDSTAQFRIGSGNDSATTNYFTGTIHQVTYYKGTALTSAQVAFLRNQWNGAISASSAVIGASVATPQAMLVATPTSGVEPFLIEPPVSTARLGPYGLYDDYSIANLLPYATFETGAGGTPTGWTEAETAGGGGTATVGQDTTTSAHSSTSVKFVLTAGTAVGSLTSACYTDVVGGTAFGQVYAKCTAGTCASSMYLMAYAGGACGGVGTRINIVAPSALTTSWAKYGGSLASTWISGACAGPADCGSYTVVWEEACVGGCTSYVDAIMLTDDSRYPDGGCFSDTGTPPTCSVTSFVITNPTAPGDMEVSADIRLPTAASDSMVHYPLGTGSGFNQFYASITSDVLTCRFYNSGGGSVSATVAAAAASNTTYPIACQRNAEGRARACFNRTCGNWTNVGYMTATGTSFYVGGASASAFRGQVWISNLQFFRALITQ